MRIEGEMNQLIHNLVIYSASLATYKGREDRFDPHWPGAIDTEEAQSVVLIDNAVGKKISLLSLLSIFSLLSIP